MIYFDSFHFTRKIKSRKNGKKNRENATVFRCFDNFHFTKKKIFNFDLTRKISFLYTFGRMNGFPKSFLNFGPVFVSLIFSFTG